MRDAVIVEAVRTPDRAAQRRPRRKCTRSTCPRPCWRAAGPRRDRAGDGRRRRVGLRQPGRRAGRQRRRATPCSPPGWPESVPGTTIDRQCGSSQQAVHFAAAGVMSGQYDIAVAGGVESMTPGADGVGDVGVGLGDADTGRRDPSAGTTGSDVQPGRRRRDASPPGGAEPRRSSTSTRCRSHQRAAAAADRRELRRRDRRPCPAGRAEARPPTRASAAAVDTREARPSSSRPSPRTAGSPRATPRRSPTARPRC